MINKVIINWYEFNTKSDMILENTFLNWNNMSNKVKYNRPYTSWVWTVTNVFWENSIMIKWTLIWTSKYDLNNKINEFLQSIYTEEDLDLEVYYQTWVSTEEKRIGKCKINTQDPLNQENWMINIVDFEFIMEIDEWTIEDEDYTDSWFQPQTGSLWHSGTIIAWTYKTYAEWEFVMKSSWITYIELVIWWETIRVDNEFLLDDELVINWETKEVRLNDVLIDYSGIFPNFKPWTWTYNTYYINLDAWKLIEYKYRYTNKYVK